MKLHEKLYLTLVGLVFLDFFTTLHGVFIRGYYELNQIVRSLYLTNNVFGFFVFTLVLTPLVIFGIMNISESDKGKEFLCFLYILLYIATIFNNTIQLL
jgi:hypothetical protein